MTTVNTETTIKFDFGKHRLTDTSEKGYEFELELPGGGKTGVFITVRGAESRQARDTAKRSYKKMQMTLQKGKKDVGIDPDLAEESALEIAVDRVISWRNLFENGIPLECTKQNIRRVLAEGWIQTQVLEKSNDLTNFLPEELT